MNPLQFFERSNTGMLHLFLLLLAVGLLAGCAIDCAPSAPGAQSSSIPDSEFRPIGFQTAQSDPLAPVGKAADDDDGESDDDDSDRFATKWITADKGGSVKLNWKNEEGITVKVTLKVLRGALDEDSQVTIGLLNPNVAMIGVDLEFGQHGTQFRIPAEVELDLKQLDLSGYAETDKLDLFWYDPVSDAWFPVRRDERKFSIDLKKGRVKGVWFFDHFSRYSLGGRGYINDAEPWAASIFY